MLLLVTKKLICFVVFHEKVVALDTLQQVASSVFALPQIEIDEPIYPIISDSLWFTCPYKSTSSSTDDMLILATVLPIILSAILLLIVLVIITLWVVWRKKRRKYYENKTYLDVRPGDEADIESAQLKYREIDYQDLVLGTLLGKGAFGKVYKVPTTTHTKRKNQKHE